MILALMNVNSALNWLLNHLETVLHVIQLVGIPVAIGLYMMNKRKERRDKDYGTYDSLDDKYIDYLKLCLEHPELDVSDARRTDLGLPTPDRQRAELVMFSILLSTMERAYLMYKDRSYRVRREQWLGWDAYIRQWCRRENFRAALPELMYGFDKRFVSYLDRIVAPPKEES